MLKEEKAELIAEIATNNTVEEDVLNALSTDEIKQQNRKLRQAVSSIGQQLEAEKEKAKSGGEVAEKLREVIKGYEKKL